MFPYFRLVQNQILCSLRSFAASIEAIEYFNQVFIRFLACTYYVSIIIIEQIIYRFVS